MSRAFAAAIKKLDNDVTKSAIINIATTQGEPGSRAIPSKFSEKDKKIGIRIDYGHTVMGSDGKKYQSFNMQINKDAEDPTLAKLEEKHKHKKYAEARVEVYPKTPDQAKQAYKNFLEDLRDDLARRSESGSDSERGKDKAKKAKGKDQKTGKRK